MTGRHESAPYRHESRQYRWPGYACEDAMRGWLPRIIQIVAADKLTFECLRWIRLQNKQRVDAMLRALLVDRFQVKVHPEMRDAPIYALVLANKEPRYTREDPPPQDAPRDPARTCGIRGGDGNVTYVNITME